MNIRKINIFMLAIISLSCMQSPIQATIANSNDTTIPHATYFSNGATLTAVTLYLGYNYLMREDALVQNKYPIAQDWYAAMTAKYPAAHFETKQFLQSPKYGVLPRIRKNCNWTSNFKHIYFPEESLKEITYLYKKVIDGYPLTDLEKLALARQEFVLLHEAGHIEHNDSRDIILSIIALFAVTHGAAYVCEQMLCPILSHIPLDAYFNRSDYFINDNRRLETKIAFAAKPVAALTFIASLITLLREKERQADKFAYRLADSETLKAAITLFENNDIDYFYNLENKKIQPLLETESTVGSITQTTLGTVDYIYTTLCQQIGILLKSTAVTRWCCDLFQDPLHPGPSVRAQNIKDELARRDHDTK